MKRVFAVLLIVAAASGLRLSRLGNRPVHHDEANQAVRCGALLEDGTYTYDPVDHHGPSLYYLTLPLALLRDGRCLAETDAVTFRLLPALLGVGLVILPLLMGDVFGRRAMLLSALLGATSPALVYYSRFYIQETLLVFFAVAFLCCLWRAIRTHRLSWAVGAGIGLGMMHATKETFIVVVGAMAGAALIVAVWGGHSPRRISLRWWRRCSAAIVIPAVIVSTLLYSSFLNNPTGVLDAVRAYGRQAWRGTSAVDHGRPWYEYLRILLWWQSGRGPVWSEVLIVLLALVGGLKLLAGNGKGEMRLWGRFFALYTVLLVVVLSAIPYKTPWNMLIFLQAFTIRAGVGGASVLNALSRRGLVWIGVVLIAAGVGDLGRQAWRASFVMEADPANPYAYSQTSRDFVGLVKRVEGIAETHPAGKAMRIDVITDPTDAWPLPWYLRAFTRVGYFSPDHVPPQIDLPVIVTAPPLTSELERYVGEQYVTELYELRPGTFLLLAVRQDLWAEYLGRRNKRGVEPGEPIGEALMEPR